MKPHRERGLGGNKIKSKPANFDKKLSQFHKAMNNPKKPTYK